MGLITLDVCVCVSVGDGGVIKGWEERTLNMSKAVRYNKELGTFTVEKAGVYFLFCQVSLPFAWELHSHRRTSSFSLNMRVLPSAPESHLKLHQKPVEWTNGHV